MKVFPAVMRLFAAGVALTLMATSVSVFATPIDLTQDTWDVQNAVDSAGNVWNDSTLTFTSQSAAGGGFDVAGYFDWTANGGALYGRVLFNGTFGSDLSLVLTEYAFDAGVPEHGLALAVDHGQVTPDGSQILNGYRGSGGGSVSAGQWEAVRVVESGDTGTTVGVPEPGSLAMMMFGVLALAFLGLRKRNHGR